MKCERPGTTKRRGELMKKHFELMLAFQAAGVDKLTASEIAMKELFKKEGK